MCSVQAAQRQINAVRTRPDLLYRIAYTERRDYRKLIRPIATQAGMDYDTQDENAWKDFTQKYGVHFPDHKLVESELPLRNAALAAGLEGYYDRAYRIYCKFTHAAFTALIGRLSADSLDNETMAHCVYCGLEAVVSGGGEAPERDALRTRLFSLHDGNSLSPGA